MKRALTILPLLVLIGCVHAQISSQMGGSAGIGGNGNVQVQNGPPAMQISPSGANACPPGVLNQVYVGCQFTTTNAIGAVTWSVSAGTLPNGLTLNTGTGLVSGTPSPNAGTYTFTIKAVDSVGNQALDPNISIVITCPPLSPDPLTAIPPAQQGVAYNHTFQPQGGITPYTCAITGSLPPGEAPSNCTLSGTPTTAGSYSFTVAQSDSCNLGAQIVTGNYTEQVNTNIAITTTSLPQATVGTLYQQTLAVSGGTGPFTWSIATGTLPAGITLNATTGILSGTPTTAGSVTFTVRVTDSLTNTATQILSINVVCTTLSIATTSPLAGGTQGQPYSFQMTAAGGQGTLTWSSPGLSGCALSITTSGLISGTPSCVGTFSPTISVHDSCSTPQSVAGVFDIPIAQPNPLAISTSTIPSAPVNTPFSFQFQATGGVTPYTWKETGTLPTGLTFSTTGILSGTPTQSGSFPITVTVTDNRNISVTSPFTIIVTCPTLVFNAPVLAQATQNQAYSFTLVSSGGLAPLTWTITSGALPTGLTLNASTGVISGTPTVNGTFPLTFQVADSCSPQQTVSQNASLVVLKQLAITTAGPALPGATAGVAYTTQMTAAGGTTPYTWSISGGALPSGMSINSSTGVISGTNSTAGVYSFTVTVTDNASATASGLFSITVSCTPLAITSTANLPSATQNNAYSFQLTSSGGFGAITWADVSGMPTGLSTSSSGLISGTPTVNGTFTPAVSATDSCSTAQTKTQTFNLTVNQQIQPLAIVTTSPLPPATVGVPYSDQMAAQGGLTPYTWSSTTGSLPNGLSVSATGLISGTPTTSGTFSTSIQVTDSEVPPVSAIGSFTLVSTCPTLSFPTQTLPQATQGQPYSFAFVTSGGVTPLTWGPISSSALPAGITFNTSTGVLSGTPTSTGIFNFSVSVSDSCLPTAQTGQQSVSLTVAANSGALTITTTSPLPAATEGVAYSQQLVATGGTPPYTWSVQAGITPTGTTLSSSGLLSGTPTQTGTFVFTAKVTDSILGTATKSLSVTVSCVPLAITSTSPLPTGTLNQAYSFTLQSSGGTGTVTWAGTGVPAGLTLSSAGVLSGTPTVTGTFTINVTATDSCAPTPQTANQSFTISINAPFNITTTSPLPQGTTGTAYSVQMAASGGVPPYTWALAAGAFPAGLSINSSGLISGTPTTAQTTTPTIRATDTQPISVSQVFSITVVCPALSITTTSPLPAARQGTAYSFQMTASGGQGALTWGGSGFPTGLSISTGGLVSGTPSVSGSFSPSINVHDSCSTPQTVSGSFTIQVNTNLAITTSTPLPGATESVAYSTSIAAAGGTPPYTFAVTAGTINAGLSLASGGAITGTCTSAGTANFTVTCTDNVSSTISKAFSLTCACTPLSITSTSPLPSGTQNQAYSFTFQKSGGTGAVTWSATGVPASLTMSSAGVLSGTATVSGTFTISVTVTDSCSPTVQSVTQAFTLTINAGISPLQITTANPLQTATVGVPFSQQMAATGGVPPYTWVSTGPVSSTCPPTGNCYYISPTGSDANTPTQAKNPATPWRTFSHSFGQMIAGDTLDLENGTYGSSTGTGYVNVNCGTNAPNGTSTAIVTVQALNERQALIQGDGSGPIFIVQNCTFWSVFGIHYEDVNQVNTDGSNNVTNKSPGGGTVNFSNSSHITFSRNIAAHDNQCGNTHLVVFGPASSNSFGERNEFYYYHREPFINWSGTTGNEFRLNYANPRNWGGAHTCIDSSGGSHTYDPQFDDPAFFNYGSSNNIWENNIVENAGHGFGDEPEGTYPNPCSKPNANNQDFGNVSLNTAYGFTTHPHSTGTTCIPTNESISNYVVVHPTVIGTYFRSSVGSVIQNSSYFTNGSCCGNVSQDVAFSGGTPNVPLGSSSPTSTITNAEVVSTTNSPAYSIVNGTSTIDHSGAFTVGVSNVTATNSVTVNPNFGSCFMWVPNASPLKGAGAGGADIGADILFQYLGGALTTTPLWTTTGAPAYAAATVPGLNDMPPGSGCVGAPFGRTSGNGCSLFDVGNRLNINRNSCAFPTGYTGSSGGTQTAGFPPGISMNSGGLISGTATSSGTFSPVITVTDSVGTSVTATFTMQSVCAPLAITTTSLPSGIQGTSYSAQITFSGGTGTVTFSQTGLPTGLSISPAGLISGTPSVSGTFAVAVTATDSCTPTAQTATHNYSLTINPSAPPLSITTGSLPNGTVGTPYSATISAAGGTPPYTFTAPASGVVFDATSTGHQGHLVSSLSWSHTVGSSSNRLITVGAAVGKNPDTGLSATATFNGVGMTSAGLVHSNNSTSGFVQLFYLVNPPTGTNTVVVTLAGGTADIEGGSVSFSGVNQSSPLTTTTAFGNSAAPAVTVASTNLDMVVDAVANGSNIASSNKTLRWLDNQNGSSAAGNAAQSTAAGAASVTMGYTVTSDFWGIIGADIAASTSTVPTGLTLSSAGVLSGTPTVAGTYTFTVTVTDSLSNTATHSYTVTISPTNPPPPSTVQLPQSWAPNPSSANTSSDCYASIFGSPSVSVTFPNSWTGGGPYANTPAGLQSFMNDLETYRNGHQGAANIRGTIPAGSVFSSATGVTIPSNIAGDVSTGCLALITSGTMTAGRTVCAGGIQDPQNSESTNTGTRNPNCGLVGAAAAHQYYVNSATGNDGNNGTSPGTAWATIAHANSSASISTAGSCTPTGTGWNGFSVPNAGACIHVNGTFTGPITTTLSGTSTQRVVWISDTRSTSAGTGAKVNNSNWQENGNFVDVDGFELTSPNNGNNFGIQTSGSASVHILYNFMHDFDLTGCAQFGIIDVGVGGLTSLTGQATDNWVIGNVVRRISTYTQGVAGCITAHGIYDFGARTIIEDNFFSSITGPAIAKKMVAGETGNAGANVISNNLVFNNGQGINITEQDNNGVSTVWDFNVITNNIVINNGIDCLPTCVGGGINYFHVTGTHNFVSNNLIYGNLPSDLMHHNASCGTSASGSTPSSGIPITGTDGNGNAGGCPDSSAQTDSGGTSATFTSFQVDTPTNPAGGYNPTNYLIKFASNAMQKGTAQCAASPGLFPCIPVTDFNQVPIQSLVWIGGYNTNVTTALSGDVAQMWTLETTGSGNAPAIKTGAVDANGVGPHHWAIVGAEIRATASPAAIVAIGNTIRSAETTVAALPSHIYFDRDWFHGDRTDSFTGVSNIQNGVMLDCATCGITNSHFSRLIDPGTESHDIWFPQATGPVKIVHNWIEGSSINIFSGGDAEYIPGQQSVNNAEIRRNRLTYPAAWLGTANWPGTSNSLSRKNASELKSGNLILFDGNIFENVDDSGAQWKAQALNPKAYNNVIPQYGTQVLNVTDTDNIWRNVCNQGNWFTNRSAANPNGNGTSLPLTLLNVSNDLLYNASKPSFCSSADNLGTGMTWGTSTAAFTSCTAARNSAGLTTTLTCTNSGTGLAQTDTNVGDPVIVAGCADTSFNVGGGTTHTMGPLALSGTNPNGLVVVYPNTGTANATTTGCTFYNFQGYPASSTTSHNTIIGAGSVASFYVNLMFGLGVGTNYMKSATVQNNILTAGGVQGQGLSDVSSPTSQAANWDLSTAVWSHNLYVGRTCSAYADVLSAGGSQVKPPTTSLCPTTLSFTSTAIPNINVNLPDWNGYSLAAGSPFKAGGTNPASDGTDRGASMPAIGTGQTRTQYVCATSCGTGPNPD